VTPLAGQEPAGGQVSQFEIPLPKGVSAVTGFALSPDGRKLVFAATDASGHNRLWLRSFDVLDARPLEGTEDPSAPLAPAFWSPDSRSIGFVAGGKLMRVGITGGLPVTICDAPNFYGGTWSRDGGIVFGTNQGIMKVSAAGGSPAALTREGLAVAPSFLPDGHHFTYMRPFGAVGKTGVYLATVEGKLDERISTRLLDSVTPAYYAPSGAGSSGYLIFMNSHVPGPNSAPLMAQPFDRDKLKLNGDAVPIAQPVTNYSVSATGVLVYSLSDTAGGVDVATLNNAGGVVHGQLAWFDREGKILGRFGDSGSYRHVALSPDGTRVAFDRADPNNPSKTRNIWLYDRARGVTTRFTFDSGWDSNPTWSPDGSRIVFASNRDNSQWLLYQKPSNLAGEDELLTKSNDGTGIIPSSWSPDGRFLLYFNIGVSNKLWLLPVNGAANGESKRVDSGTESGQGDGMFSPDGRWIAYSSNASGRTDIYVRPFNEIGNERPASGKWMVSSAGGFSPRWRRDGSELFYLSLDGTAMSVAVDTSGVFRAGAPKPLFKIPSGVLFWDVSADGKRFLMPAPTDTATRPASQARIVVVLNWRAALQK